MPRGEPSAFTSDEPPRDGRLSNGHTGDGENWADPDMAVLRLHRRPPIPLPIEVFGPWDSWIVQTAEAAACPPDFTAAPLLSTASVLVGHARWAQATPGWAEPPHLWIGSIGDSGDGKSPGADTLMRDVLPEIERRMLADFPDQLRGWRAAIELQRAQEETWKAEVRAAEKAKRAPPLPPIASSTPEPQAPRLRQNDVTVEKVAELLGSAAPKGLLIVRDELAGWIASMTAYNDAGRAFWVEAYGGRPFRIERKKHPDPIIVPRLAVAVYGGTQPEKIAALSRDVDDGLLARFLWAWPDPIPFRLAEVPTRTAWAIEALDRLRLLNLLPGSPSQPVMVPLAADAVPLLAAFGREMQEQQAASVGLLRSAYGKARGHALRLSLVLEMLWWCAADDMRRPPAVISAQAFAASVRLVREYFITMAERTYGDAAATQTDRGAATLGRWIINERVKEVHVRQVQREARLPGLRRADEIRAASDLLVEFDWLVPPPKATEFGPRSRIAYAVNPRLWERIN